MFFSLKIVTKDFFESTSAGTIPPAKLKIVKIHDNHVELEDAQSNTHVLQFK